MSGTAERSLKNANGTWDLNFKASMMIASLTEQSTLKLDNDTLLPQKYHFERGGWARRRKSISLRLDGKKVTGSDRGDAINLPLNRGVLDKSSYQLALQHDVAAGKKSMTYQVVDGDEIDTYDFRVLGTEKSHQGRPGRCDQGRARARPEPEQAHHRAVVRQGLGLPAGATAPGRDRRQGVRDRAAGRHGRWQGGQGQLIGPSNTGSPALCGAFSCSTPPPVGRPCVAKGRVAARHFSADADSGAAATLSRHKAAPTAAASMKLVSSPFNLLSLLTNSIKKACDTVPQPIKQWSLTMTVQVTERDESKMSHEGLAAGVRIWDVHQQGQLVGMFHEDTWPSSTAANWKSWKTSARPSDTAFKQNRLGGVFSCLPHQIVRDLVGGVRIVLVPSSTWVLSSRIRCGSRSWIFTAASRGITSAAGG
jgi:hypothetical protein